MILQGGSYGTISCEATKSKSRLSGRLIICIFYLKNPFKLLKTGNDCVFESSERVRKFLRSPFWHLRTRRHEETGKH